MSNIDKPSYDELNNMYEDLLSKYQKIKTRNNKIAKEYYDKNYKKKTKEELDKMNDIEKKRYEDKIRSRNAYARALYRKKKEAKENNEN